ncbi:hypothetical protein ACE3NQ_23915 [Paenibacillus terreus]|uniref:Permease n=1 Tax=Paenibacillus terreus TaxID=1387834 RepID=A0ABV5BEK3_9BACL
MVNGGDRNMFKKYNKKYWILLPPFVAAIILLEIYLPQELKKFVFVVPLVFWASYYTWEYTEKKNEAKRSQ